jgi:hypothetical protein
MEVNAAEFRANCFKILGRPKEKDPLLGAMEGLVETIGDFRFPIIPSLLELHIIVRVLIYC